MRKTPNFSSCDPLVCHATPSKAEGRDNVGTDFIFPPNENLLGRTYKPNIEKERRKTFFFVYFTFFSSLE